MPSPIAGVTIDSRAIAEGQVFFAIAGERFDGHDFAFAAAHAGAGLIVVHHRGDSVDQAVRLADEGRGPAVLEVDDTVVALQQLAAAWRDQLATAGVRVIAVTGSNGKTTTRQLIHAAMSSTQVGSQSPKSFNNHLGVPLTLLAARESDDFVVAEVGTNHPGEIAALGAILRPDAAVLTCVGTSHIGNFGSRDAIADEKTSLFNRLGSDAAPAVEGVMIFPGDDARVAAAMSNTWTGPTATAASAASAASTTSPARRQMIRFGESDNCDARLLDVTSQEAGVTMNAIVQGQTITLNLPLLGRHNARNALAALACATAVGVPIDAAVQALAHAGPVTQRLEVRKLGRPLAPQLRLLVDCYNANPDSMVAALNVLAAQPVDNAQGRRVAILGDMFELGDIAQAAHRQIGETIVEIDKLARSQSSDVNASTPAHPVVVRGGIDMVITIGDLAGSIAESLAAAWPAQRIEVAGRWRDELPADVAAQLRPGDTVLLKASRGMALERLIPAIEAKLSRAPA